MFQRLPKLPDAEAGVAYSTTYCMRVMGMFRHFPSTNTNPMSSHVFLCSSGHNFLAVWRIGRVTYSLVTHLGVQNAIMSNQLSRPVSRPGSGIRGTTQAYLHLHGWKGLPQGFKPHRLEFGFERSLKRL